MPCTVYWDRAFLCDGIENDPDLRQPMLRFSPLDGLCQPGADGTGLFVFYRD